MLLPKHRKNKKNKGNVMIIGRSVTGMTRAYAKPFVNATGDQLLNVLKINEKLADNYENGFSNEEIYIALVRCMQLLIENQTRFFTREEYVAALSHRQDFCSEAAIQLIMQNKFNHALHEFQDCIDDYGRGRARTITINEYILYKCILERFIAKLEEQHDNPELLKKEAEKCIFDGNKEELIHES